MAERLIDVSQGVLSKAIARKGSVHKTTQEKFIRTFHVKQSWWETQKGDMFEENITPVEKSVPMDFREELEELRVLNAHYKTQLRDLRKKLEECQASKTKGA